MCVCACAFGYVWLYTPDCLKSTDLNTHCVDMEFYRGLIQQ